MVTTPIIRVSANIRKSVIWYHQPLWEFKIYILDISPVDVPGKYPMINMANLLLSFPFLSPSNLSSEIPFE